MGWTIRLRELPLRTKLVVTVIGAGIALLGLSTHLSFLYWKREALAASEQQALLAAGSVRTAVESALAGEHRDQARRNLRKLVDSAPVDLARVYAPDGTIVVSADAGEEGRRIAGVWLPKPQEIPEAGLARPTASQEAVRAYLPLRMGGAAVLEVEFSVAPLQAAMDRGARIGIGLLVGSLLALMVVLFTMFEREVVGPMERVAGMLVPKGSRSIPRSDASLRGIEASVAELIEKGENAERRLEEQAGLVEVGGMAAEMAHEFKRPLASIRTAMELLEQEYALNGNGQKLLSAVDGQLDRLAETMQDLFSLARPAELEAQAFDLRAVLDGAATQLAGHPSTQGVAVERDYRGVALPVQGDPHRLEQAVLNIMLNAVEAMPFGGRLTVQARAEAERVRVTFTDTGVGIPTDQLDRVMRPFYSTKATGTGLGLPLVARVVAAHGGRLRITSEPGSGTSVTIDLPARARASGNGHG
ncbi:MAG TPA: ATP-binding protein [Longimicrobiales bacterium]|nr:ATP-binding protein [Longimicrobiales bacterium]